MPLSTIFQLYRVSLRLKFKKAIYFSYSPLFMYLSYFIKVVIHTLTNSVLSNIDVYPCLHVHVYPPTVFLHSAVSIEQLCN